jgi:hypothetical protein
MALVKEPVPPHSAKALQNDDELPARNSGRNSAGFW